MTQGSASVAVGNDARADSAGPGNLAVAVGNPGYNPAYNGVVPTHALTDGSGNVAFAIGDGTTTGPVRLTKRETEIIKLLDVGMSNREIGEKLFISRHTVKIHVQNILAKLDVDSRAKAAACYRAGNCVTPKEKDVTPKEKDHREERRALLEQRRAAVAHQLRRLAIELTDLDRQLDDIEQSHNLYARWNPSRPREVRRRGLSCAVRP